MPEGTTPRAQIDGIARCFASRWHQGYARGKLRHDPVFADATLWAQKSERAGTPILDAGCGLGLLAHWLRGAELRVPIRGVDPDAGKIAAASAAAAQAGLTDVDFAAEDARTAVPRFEGSVFLLDVLHYLPLEDRADLLTKLAARLPPGGVVYVRNGLHTPGWRHRLTQLEEWFVRWSGWIPTRGIRLPRQEEISQHFPAELFTSEIGPLWGRTPFNSYRLAFQRRPH